MTSPIVITKGITRSSILMKCLGKNGFLYTNKRHSSTIGIIALPGPPANS